MSADPLIAVLAEAARLGEAALEAGGQADFGRLIDLAVQAGSAVTSVHSEDESDVIPSAEEASFATSVADELRRLSEAADVDSRASEACFARLEAASDALETRTALRSAGAIAAAVRVLGRSHSNARVQESGCRALARFAGADRQSRVCACQAGAAKTARSAIEAHPEDAYVGDEAGVLLCALALLRPDTRASPLQPAEPHAGPHAGPDVADEAHASLVAARRKQQQASRPAPAELVDPELDPDPAGPGAGVTDMLVDGSTRPEWPLTLDELPPPWELLPPPVLEPQFMELLVLAPTAGAMAAADAEPEVPGAPQSWPALRETELCGEE